MPQMPQVLRERAIGMLTVGMSTRAVAHELSCCVLFSTISRLQRRFSEFGSTSNRSSPPRSSETSHPDSCCNNRFDNQRISAQTVRNRLREAHLCMLFIHIGVLTWQQFVVITDFGEAFSSRINLYMADMASCGWVVCWCQRCGSSGPWWRWGYGMGRRMLWTTNTGAFYWWDTVTRS